VKATLIADWGYESSYYYTRANDLKQKPYHVVDARLKFTLNENSGSASGAIIWRMRNMRCGPMNLAGPTDRAMIRVRG